MQSAVPLACFLSLIRPPGVQYENALLQIAPVDKSKCPFIKDNNDIGFQLFTRHNPTAYQELVIGDDEKLFASNIDFHDSTVLYFHAFMEQPDDGSGIMVREAYMQRGDTNVIMIDAHHLEAGPWYFTAAQNTWYIGRFAAQFIDYLVSRGLNLNNTHLVGHSLGAQAAGVAGSALKSGRVSRITGLDPALPLFDHLPLEQRLDTSDADFVDVIHTDAGIFGYNVPIGHVDYYPNGGKSPQPGCELEVVIPQQLLLNKCDGRTHTRGFYTFYLTAKQERELKDRSIEIKLQKLFAFIKSVKNSTKSVKSVEYRTQESIIDNEDLRVAPIYTKYRKQSLAKKIHVDKPVSKLIVLKEEQTFDQNETPTLDEALIIKEKDEAEVNEELNQQRLKAFETVSLIKNNEELLKNVKHKLRSTEGYEFHVLPTIKRDKRHANTDGIKENVKRHDTTTYKNQIEPKNLLHKLDNNEEEEKNIKDLDSETKPNQEQASRELEDKTTFRDKRLQKKHLHLAFNDINKKSQVVKRQKRFIPFLKRDYDDNFLFRILDFLNKNRKNILPVYTVMREISTLVKSGNGELNHFSKERNNYIGAPPPFIAPVTYSLELGNESKAIAFVKRLLGMSPKGDRLTVSSG